MNERIRELIEECTDRHFPEGDNMFETFDKQRFAELIVRECLQVISKSDATCSDEWDYAERDLHGLIKSHFGVES